MGNGPVVSGATGETRDVKLMTLIKICNAYCVLWLW